jgi:hypothetical protein
MDGYLSGKFVAERSALFQTRNLGQKLLPIKLANEIGEQSFGTTHGHAGDEKHNSQGADVLT